MIKVFKTVLICALIVILFVSVISCGKDEVDDKKTTEATNATEEVTVADTTAEVFTEGTQNNDPIELPIVP